VEIKIEEAASEETGYSRFIFGPKSRRVGLFSSLREDAGTMGSKKEAI
jgi:hypothetical protein